MYTKIQEMKSQGFSQNRTAIYLNIHRDTVNRYWNMTADDYREYSEKIKRISVLESYRTVIESWIHKYPCISAAQICDWLKEDYAEDFKERTVSRFVKALREQLGIPKSAPPPRVYGRCGASSRKTDAGRFWRNVYAECRRKRQNKGQVCRVCTFSLTLQICIFSKQTLPHGRSDNSNDRVFQIL